MIRDRRPTKAPDHVREAISKLTAQIYIFFAIGLVIKAIGLKPQKVNLSGLELGIEHPDAIPGAIFAVCLAMYFGLFAQLAIYGPYVGYGSFERRRNILLEALHRRKIRTFKRRLSVEDRRTLRALALGIARVNGFAMYAYRLTPLIYIVLRELPAVWRAISGVA